MPYVIQFIIVFLLIPLIDYFWLGLLMKQFYLSELGSLLRTSNGTFSPLMPAAIGVYIMLAFGVVALVLPLAGGQVKLALIYGACLGLVVYGVYDLTNLALIQNWPIKMTVVDILWGTFLCATVSALTLWLHQKLISIFS